MNDIFVYAAINSLVFIALYVLMLVLCEVGVVYDHTSVLCTVDTIYNNSNDRKDQLI